MSAELLIIVLAAGALGQLMDSLAGLGFGALSNSILLAGGVSPVAAAATVNLAKVGSGLSGGLAHVRFGNVHRPWLMPLVLSGILGSVFGAVVLTRLPTDVTLVTVPLILMAVGMYLMLHFLRRSRSSKGVAAVGTDLPQNSARGLWDRLKSSVSTSRPLSLGSIGIVAGALNAVSGVFGPFATSSLLLTRRRRAPRYTVGTVSIVEFFVAGSASVVLLLHLIRQPFGWQLPLILMLGSVLTAPVGAYFVRRIPGKAFGAGLGLILIALNLWSFLRALGSLH